MIDLDDLLTIEQGFWRAAGDRDQYDRHLAADVIHVFPGWGFADREAVLAGVAEADPFESFSIEHPHILSLGGDAAALVHKGHAQRAGRPPYEAAITSVYRRRDRSWELVLHQQASLPAGEP